MKERFITVSRVTLSELLVLLITARGLVENAPDLGPVTSGTGLLLMYLWSQNIVMVNVSILLINIFHDNKRIFFVNHSVLIANVKSFYPGL